LEGLNVGRTEKTEKNEDAGLKPRRYISEKSFRRDISEKRLRKKSVGTLEGLNVGRTEKTEKAKAGPALKNRGRATLHVLVSRFKKSGCVVTCDRHRLGHWRKENEDAINE